MLFVNILQKQYLPYACFSQFLELFPIDDMIKCEFEGHCMEMHLSFYVMSCFNVVVGLIGPQIPPGRMDPMHNNAPLQFNTNKGKPPMALEGDPGIAEYIRN